ncbi:MAG: DUF4270 domain-containing protein [Alistipes sp.]|jgi:hypothetical protein|nr:DUF4270 domain-containing protein [Alistipes sp.]
MKALSNRNLPKGLCENFRKGLSVAARGFLLSSSAAGLIVGAAGCTEVDDRLGNNLRPGNQWMEIEVTSPEGGVDTYLYRDDSIPSSRLVKAFLGRMSDANGIFGAQTGSALLQFVPMSRPYATAEGYGLDPIVDSAVLVMGLDEARGDTTQMQKFDVYEINEGSEWLHRDSVYYSSFPIGQYRGEKLFEFTHTGRRNVDARLFPTAAGKEYLDRIVSLGWDDYISDSLFRRKFRGLYITPADGSPTAAALYATNLAASGIELYVRNHDSIDRTAIYDTLITLFTFADRDQTDSSTGYVTRNNNVSVAMAEFDYTGSVLGTLETATGGFTDTLPDSPTRQTVYVQPMGGVGTYLRFTEELVDQIRAIADNADGDIMINQAMMTVWLEDDSTPALDASLNRLGSYLDITLMAGIPDYQYQTEAWQRQTDASYTLPYGGYLNRSNGYYQLDITAYVQGLAKKEGDRGWQNMPRVFLLAPEAESTFGFGQSALKGTGSDKPATIRITYTVIEG